MKSAALAVLLAFAHAASASAAPWGRRRIEPWQQPKPWDPKPVAARTAASLGARAVYLRPTDLPGAWGPGVQAKVPLGGSAAAQLSVDRVRASWNGGAYRVTPVQLTGLWYLGGKALSPFALLGVGWYRVDSPTGRDTLNHPHAGAGLELLGGDGWSLDGSYRLGFSAVYKPFGRGKPFGERWRSRGSMWTIGLSRRF